MRSSKPIAFGLVALGGALVVLAAGRTWIRVRPLLDTALVDRVVDVSGREAAPATAALGLVALAGAVALVTSGAVVRRVVAALLVVAGAGTLAVTVAFLRDPGGAARAAAARATGVTGSVGFTSTGTVWPAVCAAAALLVVAGGVVAVLRAGRWGGPSRRYEATSGAGAVSALGAEASRRDRAYDAWDALSDGADPTDDGTHGPGAPSAGGGIDETRTA
jgi:uncharacterized membrane protein (TIGR02234 family)